MAQNLTQQKAARGKLHPNPYEPWAPHSPCLSYHHCVFPCQRGYAAPTNQSARQALDYMWKASSSETVERTLYNEAELCGA